MANQPLFAPLDSSPPMRCIHFGRLVHEKGSDRIVDLAEQILTRSDFGVVLDIYGDGPFGKEILQRFSGKLGFFDGTKDSSIAELGYTVAYYGHRPKQVIEAALQRSHYLLMPSRFLETFGLSALESISQWVPVIAFAQGGLTQFLQSQHALVVHESDAENTQDFLHKVWIIADQFRIDSWKRESDTARSIAQRYTPENWMIQVGKSIPLGVQKILLVTDYAHTVGGIETHVQEIRSTLTKMGYITEIYAPLVGKERVIRYLGLLLSFCNIFAYWSLKQKIQKFSPDLIWCHSVARVIGPVGLQAVHTNGALCYKTYHDLGYFSPFATNATSEKTFLSQRYTLQEFLSESRWWQWPYVILKYFKLSWIFKILGRFDLHIIPSAFLEESLARVLPPESRIIVLPHTHALWK